MEQCRNDPCVFRMVVDVKAELIMAAHVDHCDCGRIEWSMQRLPCRVNYEIPHANNFGELTWYTGCAFKRT